MYLYFVNGHFFELEMSQMTYYYSSSGRFFSGVPLFLYINITIIILQVYN
jgi:hypothetical protein